MTLRRTFSRGVDPALARQVLEFGDRLGMHSQVYIDGELVYREKSRYSDYYESSYAHPGIVMPDLMDLPEIITPKVLFVIDEDKIAAVKKEAEKLFPMLTIKQSKPMYLEFAHPSVDKGEALAFTAGHYGVRREEVIAVGDTDIDIPMLKYAGLGVPWPTPRLLLWKWRTSSALPTAGRRRGCYRKTFWRRPMKASSNWLILPEISALASCAARMWSILRSTRPTQPPRPANGGLFRVLRRQPYPAFRHGGDDVSQNLDPELKQSGSRSIRQPRALRADRAKPHAAPGDGGISEEIQHADTDVWPHHHQAVPQDHGISG